MAYEYFYILQTLDFFDSNVYKIGKTKQQPMKRFQQYEKGARLELVIRVKNCCRFEAEIINLFKEKFKLVAGREFFEGSLQEMIEAVFAAQKAEKEKAPALSDNKKKMEALLATIEVPEIVKQRRKLLSEIIDEIDEIDAETLRGFLEEKLDRLQNLFPHLCYKKIEAIQTASIQAVLGFWKQLLGPASFCLKKKSAGVWKLCEL